MFYDIVFCENGVRTAVACTFCIWICVSLILFFSQLSSCLSANYQHPTVHTVFFFRLSNSFSLFNFPFGLTKCIFQLFDSDSQFAVHCSLFTRTLFKCCFLSVFLNTVSLTNPSISISMSIKYFIKLWNDIANSERRRMREWMKNS